jgi:threonine synthase
LQLVKREEIKLGEEIYITVPSGNFGNALGGFYAKMMGLPLRKILISSNQNNILTDFIKSGEYSLSDRKVVNTKSPAMDILKSSNVERVLFHLFGAERTRELMESLEKNGEYKLNSAEVDEVQKLFSASFSTDEECFDAIEHYYERGYLMDPHTATAIKAHENCREEDLKNIAYSTAEWTKFSPSIIEALNIEVENAGKSVSDREALFEISKRTGTEIPHQIEELFTKEITHKTVINVNSLESEILKFL